MSKGDPIYCVYEYLRPDTMECFYVGYGMRIRARYWRGTRNKAFKKVVKELESKGLEPYPIILESNLTQNEAMVKEQERIRYRLSTGAPLTNSPKRLWNSEKGEWYWGIG